MKKSSFWDKPISRKEFIKKGLLAAAGIGAGAYFVKKYFESRQSIDTFSNFAPKELPKWSHEAYHYTQLGYNVQCQVCPNLCILGEDDRSHCRNKINKNGKLYTLAYGNPCAVHVDPIEKKPLFHFLPGTNAFSIATAGCNFRCLNCQNWEISQQFPDQTSNMDMMPDAVVDNAAKKKAASIAYTYSEPIAYYEYMYDISKLARKQGVKNVWVTNGYINTDALKDLAQYIDGASINLKSFDEDVSLRLNGGTLKPVLNTLKTMKGLGVWFEVINLIVPGWTDDINKIKEMIDWLYKNIGPDYPLHFSRFFPMYKLTHLSPTPLSTLQKARKLALDAGMHFVYIGNAPEVQEEQNTYCPKCNKLLIERKGYEVTQNNLADGYCKFCGEKIAGYWKA